MKYANILAHLSGTDEGKALVGEFTSLVNENTTIKEQLETAENKVASLGDRDVGALIAQADWLKENGLDTPEKLSEYKSKADGLELTNAELQTNAETLKTQLEESSQKVNEEASQVMLKADVKVALAPRMGDKAGYSLAIDDMFNKGLITRGEDGGILYNEKPLDDSIEDCRNAYPFALKEKPEGTGNPPQAGNPPRTGTPNSNKPYWKK